MGSNTFKFVVFGACSAIAMETQKLFAAEGAHFMLIARDEEKLKRVKDDLLTRGAGKVEILAADLKKTSLHRELIGKADELLDGFNTVFIAYGMLPDQEKCQRSFRSAKDALEVNFVSAVSILTHSANYLEQKGAGRIAVITSVAGDRGRKSNYIYGAAKGALDIFLGGLRNRLSSKGITVTTIKPGFVDTPMTERFKKGLLFASPQYVGKGIYRAIIRRREMVYIPWYWRFIMLIICSIPERFFKNMSI